MKKIAIIGLGLIGGSIGLGLKKSALGPEVKIVGIPRRPETIELAKRLGAIDEGEMDLKKGVAGADIVFICTPINLIVATIKEISASLKKGAIVTDVGSSKEDVVTAANKIMQKGAYFVGGHPMAGKEKTKLDAAEGGLFEGKIWVLAVNSKTSRKALDVLREIINKLGAEVVEMDFKKHDQAVAGISHMPLAIAASMVNAVAGVSNEEMKKCAASGFKDATRIASGDPQLGKDMFITNSKPVAKMISQFKKALSEMEKAINAKDEDKISALLTRAKEFRDSIYG